MPAFWGANHGGRVALFPAHLDSSRHETATGFVAISSVALAAPLQAQDAFPAPVGVRIPLAPTPLPAMGHTILAYELHLSSLAPIELSLSHIDVFVDGATTPAAVYRDAELGAMRLDPSGKSRATGTLAAGGFDVIFIWLELTANVQPKSLRNVVVVKAGGAEASVEAKVGVRPAREAPVLGPPLRGGPWVREALNGMAAGRWKAAR